MKYNFVKFDKYDEEIAKMVVEAGFTTHEELSKMVKNNHDFDEEMKKVPRGTFVERHELINELREKYSPMSLSLEINSNEDFRNIMRIIGFEKLQQKTIELIETFKSMGYGFNNYKWVLSGVARYFRINDYLMYNLIEDKFDFESLSEYDKVDMLKKCAAIRAYYRIKDAINWLELVLSLVELNKEYPHKQLMSDLKYVVYGTMHISPSDMKIHPTNKTVGNIKIYIPNDMVEIHLFDNEKK